MTNVADEQLGKLARQWADLFRRICEGSVGPEYVAWWLQRIKEQKLPVHEIFASHEVRVDHNLPLAEALQQAGCTFQGGESFTDRRLPPTGTGIERIELHLVKFVETMRTDQVLEELGKQNLRPANVKELLALADQYQDVVASTNPSIALGSIWVDSNGGDVALLLAWDGRELYAGSGSISTPWPVGCRFAAVAK